MGQNRIRIIILVLMLSFSACFGAINAVCELILDDSEIAHGIKEGNTQCILTTDVKWKIRIDGDIEEAKQALFKVCIHMQYHRTCQVPIGFSCGYKSYGEIIGKTFSYKCYTGMYYVEVETDLNGQVEENRLYFYCLTPPRKSYTEPYDYPISNQRPYTTGEIMNLDQNDIITGSIVQFRIDGHDNDGDMTKGVLYWKIMTKWEVIKPVHTPNYYAPAERDQYKTYLYYSGQPIIQEWDTRLNPSDIGEYELYVFAIDEHGRFGSGFQKTFYYYGGGEEPPNVVDLPPEPPRNLRFVSQEVE